MQTMIFAIERINRDARLLPNITLGYKIYDSCSDPVHALHTAMDLIGGVEASGEGSDCRGVVPVVMGDGGSTLSMVVAHFLGVFHLPQVTPINSFISLLYLFKLENWQQHTNDSGHKQCAIYFIYYDYQ